MEQEKGLRLNKKHIYILCFLLPLSVMIGCMVYYGVQPFGDKSFIIVDGLHQYMPFFSVLYDKLKGGDNLFYSFRIGLGVNFLSLFAYYLSSPLNLVILLFRKTSLNMAVSMLVTLKIALSGLTAGIYFYHRSRRPDLSVVAAACLYALNSYMVGYSWNVMWLDSIMIFPIIMMGIEILIEEEDGRLYCLALFYALYCNYYIAFMICIFSVIWYLLYPFRNYGQFFLRGCAFAFYSLLAGGLASVLLIPAYMGIKQTASGGEMMLPSHEWLTGFGDLMTRQLEMTAPISHDNFDGNINLYFGISALFALFMYLQIGEIKLVRKIKAVLLLGFLYLSFNENILNFIWHGFHDQYGIPNRFSFLFGFVLICIFVEVLDHREEVKNRHTVVSSALGVGMLYLSRSYAETPLEDIVYGAAGMLFVFYGTVLLLMTMDRRRKIWYIRLFCMAAVVEICASAVMGFGSIGQISVSKFFSGTEDMEEAVDELSDGTFYRSELADAKLVDESSWYRLNGISLFGSTAMENTVNIMDNLGFYTGCNEYLYKGATPLTDVMLDVRYLYFHPEDTLKTDYEYKKSFGNFSVYENPVKNISVGYVTDRAINNWYYDSAYPFRVLNDFSYQGYSYDNIFKTLDVPEPVTKGCRVEKTNDGEYHFFYDRSDDNNIVFTIPVKKTIDKLYLFYDGTQVERVRIEVDGESVISGDKDGSMLYVGQVKKNSSLLVHMRLKGENSDGYIRLSAADFDVKQFNRLTKVMTGQAFKVSRWSSGYMEGTAVAGPDQMLFFSIPYDKGWKILVDGKRADPAFIGNAFLAVDLPEGEHKVSISYTPPGFAPGLRLSLFSLAVFITTCIAAPFIRKRRAARSKRKRVRSKRRTADSTQPPQTDSISQQGSGDTQAAGEQGCGPID
ncbi:MAG: YfhO family protein [Eubacterium sp.]|nr:YfhO family protein [Eubacterium sp.]